MTFKLGQTLYAPTKLGNVKTWCCAVDDLGTEARLTITTQTKMGGKAVVREEYIDEGKNLGKSNETTPYQQATSEAESRYRKKLDQGYRTDVPTDTSKAGTNTMNWPKPMLAHPIDKVADEDLKFPAYVQPKLDGHRAIVTKREGEMFMYSRQGKLIETMQHILDALDPVMDDGDLIDGELYVHGKALQNIGSLIKKQQPGSEKVEFWVYDIMTEDGYEERYKALTGIIAGVSRLGMVHLLASHTVTCMEQAMAHFATFISRGYEGAMLRLLGVGYEAGFRSRHLLKIKEFEDHEYEIVDVVEGKDRIVNQTNLKVACFKLKADNGKIFEVTSPGDQFEKDAHWHNRKQLIGNFCTVKHMGYTQDGIPWHPVALRIREDI